MAFISQKVGTGLIIAIVIVLNLLLMGNHGGRGGDYIEQQNYTDSYIDTAPVETPKSYEDLKQEYQILKQLFETATPTISPK